MRRLITVLLAAVLILVLGMIAAIMTSCEATSTSATQAVLVQPTAQPTPIQNGHEWHPWRLQDHDGTQATLWSMASGDDATPRSKWHVVNWTITNEIVVKHLHTASFVLYNDAVYQIITIDVARHFIEAYQQ